MSKHANTMIARGDTRARSKLVFLGEASMIKEITLKADFRLCCRSECCRKTFVDQSPTLLRKPMIGGPSNDVVTEVEMAIHRRPEQGAALQLFKPPNKLRFRNTKSLAQNVRAELTTDRCRVQNHIASDEI